MAGDEDHYCGTIFCRFCHVHLSDAAKDAKKDAQQALVAATQNSLNGKHADKVANAKSKRTRNSKPPAIIASSTATVGSSSTRSRNADEFSVDMLSTSSTKEALVNSKACPGKGKVHDVMKMKGDPGLHLYLTSKYWGSEDHYPTHCANCHCPIFCGSEKKWEKLRDKKHLDEFGNPFGTEYNHAEAA